MREAATDTNDCGQGITKVSLPPGLLHASSERSRHRTHRLLLKLSAWTLAFAFPFVLHGTSFSSEKSTLLAIVSLIVVAVVYYIARMLLERRYQTWAETQPLLSKHANLSYLRNAFYPRNPSYRQTVAALAWLAVALLFLFIPMSLGDEIKDLGSAAVMMLSVICVLAVYVYERSNHPYARIGAIEVLSKDPMAPVLLLRAFREDYLYEDLLTEGLSPIGPVIALGRPGEGLPRPGALRLYAKDEDWKDVVAQAFESCRLVVFIVSKSEGLQWEEALAVEKVPPEKLLLFFPDHSLDGWWRRVLRPSSSEREERFQGFKNRVSTELRSRLPDALGDASFLYFDRDWSCFRLGVNRAGSSPLAKRSKALMDGLHVFLRERFLIPSLKELVPLPEIQDFVIGYCDRDWSFERLLDALAILKHPRLHAVGIAARAFTPWTILALVVTWLFTRSNDQEGSLALATWTLVVFVFMLLKIGKRTAREVQELSLIRRTIIKAG